MEKLIDLAVDGAPGYTLPREEAELQWVLKRMESRNNPRNVIWELKSQGLNHLAEYYIRSREIQPPVSFFKKANAILGRFQDWASGLHFRLGWEGRPTMPSSKERLNPATV